MGFAQTVPGLRPGIHTQHYRAASGFAQFRPAWLRDGHDLGVVGIVEHANGNLGADGYRRARDEAQHAGYQSGVAFGLGDVGDHAAETGRRIAAIAKHAEYLVPDMEGLWEDDGALDERRAIDMFDAIRQALPDIPIVDQPPSRPIAGHHGSRIWRTMAKYTTARAPMLYLCNLAHDGPGGLGLDAYERIMPEYVHDWDVTVPATTPAGIVPDPVIPTWQSYHWVPEAHVHALLSYRTCLHWGENHGHGTGCHALDDQSQGPYPTARARFAMRVAARLRAEGFDGPRAVAAFCAARGLPPPPMRVRQDGKASWVPQLTAPLLAALGVSRPLPA